MSRPIRNPCQKCPSIRDAAFVIRTSGHGDSAHPIQCHYIIVPFAGLTGSERALFGAKGYTWFDRSRQREVG